MGLADATSPPPDPDLAPEPGHLVRGRPSPEERRARLAGVAHLVERARPVTLAGERTLPVAPPLAPLLPDGGLRRGTTVAVTGSTTLALALLGEATWAGSWAAAVGVPDLGLVAAAELGVDLARLAVVPDVPRERWATVVAALLDGLDVVVSTAPSGARAADARRLAARARERGSVLIALTGPGRGAWPDATDVGLSVASARWEGLGQGHGHLRSCRLDVVGGGRGAASRRRSASLLLPAPGGGLAAALPEGPARAAGQSGQHSRSGDPGRSGAPPAPPGRAVAR